MCVAYTYSWVRYFIILFIVRERKLSSQPTTRHDTCLLWWSWSPSTRRVPVADAARRPMGASDDRAVLFSLRAVYIRNYRVTGKTRHVRGILSLRNLIDHTPPPTPPPLSIIVVVVVFAGLLMAGCRYRKRGRPISKRCAHADWVNIVL